MKHTSLTSLLLAVLLAACSVPAPIDSQATAVVSPTAQITATASPTATATPSATRTRKPTKTAKPTKPTKTPSPKPTKTPKPKPFYGCFAANGINGPTAPFKIEARTGRRVEVYINGVSRNGDNPIYCAEVVRQGVPVFLTLMWGNYTYIVQVGGRGTLQGSFFINGPDKATMRVFEDKIAIGPFP